ncbi:AAA family ATPase [Pseudoxanthomonas sp. CF125]|uniref:AAA family ATPase n=1 Tax=Pseudoxanthomonas sp. CF125 TaxID=1855303 RepID=UPI0008912D49|nr:AAA family ATPase [Pseudoxanthomonas sp. CF125]SDR14822.1 DNA helicase/exodeoxyribonuclease V, alpha subunit [Pseudoxanthomonas sp. CF125]
MKLIAHLQRSQDSLRAVDIALADTLRRLDPASDELVLAGAALASLAVGTGHTACAPARLQLLLGSVPGLPEADEWIAAWRASPWVSEPEADAVAPASFPLVLENGLLYLRRYREYERGLASCLKRLAAQSPTGADLAAIRPLFDALFPGAQDGDRQARAAALALVQSLLLITGGPGTGKTTTIARLLLLLIAQADADGAALRIALAAPTGRAADRMSESLHAAVANLQTSPLLQSKWLAALPRQASTLHRLLGSRPGSPRFQHHAGQPLPFDVIVVDEASMVDMPLMSKLVDAVADGARLILLGDRDQLPSVEAGDVLAAIGDAAGDGDTLPEALASSLSPLLPVVPRRSDGRNDRRSDVSRETTSTIPEQSDMFDSRNVGPSIATHAPKEVSLGDVAPTAAPALERSPLFGHRVQLLRGYRQSAELDLSPLANAVREGDADAALGHLRDGRLRGVHFHEEAGNPLASDSRSVLLAHWRALAAEADPAAALKAADRLRLLTALREGPQGASTLNAQIEEALAGAQRETYFHGRLLLVTENSYRHGLFNGDVGICLRQVDGNVAVFFSNGGQDVRAFHPAALPAHASAFALTVHKAQGSEFDQAWIVLPQQDARTLTRELLYTALTRARNQVHLFAREDILRTLLARKAQRVTGLAERLA